METGPKSHKVLNEGQFKSYYVVWKLTQGKEEEVKVEVSLNRTMQYGNK